MKYLIIQPASPNCAEAGSVIADLDIYLNGLYPPEPDYLDSAQGLSQPHVHFLIAYAGGSAAGCGAVKLFFLRVFFSMKPR